MALCSIIYQILIITMACLKNIYFSGTPFIDFTFLEHYLLKILFWNIIYWIYFSETIVIEYTFLEHYLLNILFWNIINWIYFSGTLFINIYFSGTLLIDCIFLEHWRVSIYCVCWGGDCDIINLGTINNNCLLDWSLYLCV